MESPSEGVALAEPDVEPKSNAKTEQYIELARSEVRDAGFELYAPHKHQVTVVEEENGAGDQGAWVTVEIWVDAP